ncbi:MAG TPA: AMP-binding protein, partial [Ktedonobacteraceae bacterium]
IAFYGTLKAGAIVVLGSPLSTAEEISAQLRDSGARTLLTLTSYRALAASLAHATELREIIYTDVREYLPLYRRVLLASLIEGPSGQQEPGDSSSLHSARASVPGFSFQQLEASSDPFRTREPKGSEAYLPSVQWPPHPPALAHAQASAKFES